MAGSRSERKVIRFEWCGVRPRQICQGRAKSSNGADAMKTEADGYRDGLASGKRVPREPDYFDAVPAGNVGGPQ